MGYVEVAALACRFKLEEKAFRFKIPTKLTKLGLLPDEGDSVAMMASSQHILMWNPKLLVEHSADFAGALLADAEGVIRELREAQGRGGEQHQE